MVNPNLIMIQTINFLLLCCMFFGCQNIQPPQKRKNEKQYTFLIKNQYSEDTLSVSFVVDSSFQQASFGADCWTDSDKCYGFIKNGKCYFHLNCWNIRSSGITSLDKVYRRDSINTNDAYRGRVISKPKYCKSKAHESMILEYWYDNSWDIIYYKDFLQKNISIRIAITTLDNVCDIKETVLSIAESIEVRTHK